MRREYPMRIMVNGVFIVRVIIDSHYENKHSQSVNDELILRLIRQLDGRKFDPVSVKKPFSYFVDVTLLDEGKNYKLVWLLEDWDIYIGVVNCHRR